MSRLLLRELKQVNIIWTYSVCRKLKHFLLLSSLTFFIHPSSFLPPSPSPSFVSPFLGKAGLAKLSIFSHELTVEPWLLSTPLYILGPPNARITDRSHRQVLPCLLFFFLQYFPYVFSWLWRYEICGYRGQTVFFMYSMVCFEYVYFVDWLNEVIKVYITLYILILCCVKS